jgi:two-component system sensor histidine kinase ChvG
MASAIATVKPEAHAGQTPRRWKLPGSRLGQLIIVLNLLGLTILIGGALVLNELSRGLINAKIDSLTTQGEALASVIEQAATQGEPIPLLDPDLARETLQVLFIPRQQRARVFDASGAVIADSYVIAEQVEAEPLPPVRATCGRSGARPGTTRRRRRPWPRRARS